MKYVDVYIERNTLQLDQLFTYSCDQDIYPGCRVRILFHHKECVAFVQKVKEKCSLDKVLPVLEVIDKKPLLNDELFQLADFMASRFVASKISCYKTMLPPALRPASNKPKVIYEDWLVLGKEIELTSRQQEVVDELKSRLPIRASIARKEYKTMIKTLLEKEALYLEKKPKSLALESYGTQSAPELSDQQRQAIEKILNTKKNVCLLHGVTGSGKTEVFLSLASTMISQGKQVLFLVPEIGLTPMMIKRVKARFQDRVAIYHSSLNAQEKYDQYIQVKANHVSIVVGTRSAIFLPFENLGLILLDEEHDSSYKQDSMPRYHTKDIALFRAHAHNCKVILASATPSLESMARAKKGQYEYVSLDKRIYTQLPLIECIDMKMQPSKNGLSEKLLAAIESTITNSRQVILMLNRRGYYPISQCVSCGHIMTCPDCGVALSYHKDIDRLMCHVCGRVFSNAHECPECHSTMISSQGMGTQRLEELLKDKFPCASIYRMDADSTRKKNGHATILKSFEEKGDILIGTQMVSKGLDFDKVDLVGILQADMGLSRSDYRANEQTFSLLEQASGRCGRQTKQGHVLIQTFDPDHFVIQCVKNHDYNGFFSSEMAYRKLGMYPPFTFLATLIFSGYDQQALLSYASLIKQMPVHAKILGPVSISMRQKKQRVRLIIKAKHAKELESIVWQIVSIHQKQKTKFALDVNMYPIGLED